LGKEKLSKNARCKAQGSRDERIRKMLNRITERTRVRRNER